MLKEVSEEDHSWPLDIEIPLEFIEEFFGEAIDKDYWFGKLKFI